MAGIGEGESIVHGKSVNLNSCEGTASGVKEDLKQGKMSFRDKLVGNSSMQFQYDSQALQGDRFCIAKGKQRDPSPPSITFSEEIREIFSQPYKDAVVLKVLDKNLSYTALLHKLKGVWKLRGGFDLLDIGKGYFLTKLDLAEERVKVLTGGPWILNGH